jgi:hypothetical protein
MPLLRSPALGMSLAAAFLVAIFASSASASVTLGSSLATEPTINNTCQSATSDRGCLFIQDVLPGREFVAASTGTIVRWRVRLGNNTDAQTVRIRIVRRVSTNTFNVISSGPLESIPAGAGSYSFPAQLPIRPGDQVGFENEKALSVEVQADSPGANNFVYGAPGPLDGETTEPPTFVNPDIEGSYNVDLNPDNAFTLGAVTRNKKKGTETLNLTVPNPGELDGSGNGVNAASTSPAGISKSVGTGPAQLLIKATGTKKKKLKQKGKVKLNVAVTYTPTGGDPSTQSLKVKLKKKL